jgi:DNA-binding transcriptional ArsR family regulator
MRDLEELTIREISDRLAMSSEGTRPPHDRPNLLDESPCPLRLAPAWRPGSRLAGPRGEDARAAGRRAILRQLAASDARVTDIASGLPISLNSVSKHIRLLERAGLVARNISGREHILRFRPSPLAGAQQWIATQQSYWASRLQAIDDLLTAEDAANPKLSTKETTRARTRHRHHHP